MLRPAARVGHAQVVLAGRGLVVDIRAWQILLLPRRQGQLDRRLAVTVRWPFPARLKRLGARNGAAGWRSSGTVGDNEEVMKALLPVRGEERLLDPGAYR